jgi:carbamoylphosphate synthase large subunit
MGGQTALNTALSLKRMGVLERYNVEMIGAKPEAIDMAEDRALFREAMDPIGLETPRSFLANATEIKDTDRKFARVRRRPACVPSSRATNSTRHSTRWRTPGTWANPTASSAT